MTPSEKSTFLLVNVGCLECGIETIVLGVYETEDEAIEAWKREKGSWHSGNGYQERKPETSYGSVIGGDWDCGSASLQIHKIRSTE